MEKEKTSFPISYEEQKAIMAEAWKHIGSPKFGENIQVFGQRIPFDGIGIIPPIFIEYKERDFEVHIDAFDPNKGPQSGEIKELFTLEDLTAYKWASDELIERLKKRTDILEVIIKLHKIQDELEEWKGRFNNQKFMNQCEQEYLFKELKTHKADKKEIKRILRDLGIKIKKDSQLAKLLTVAPRHSIDYTRTDD